MMWRCRSIFGASGGVSPVVRASAAGSAVAHAGPRDRRRAGDVVRDRSGRNGRVLVAVRERHGVERRAERAVLEVLPVAKSCGGARSERAVVGAGDDADGAIALRAARTV